MAGKFRYKSGEQVLAYRVESLPCEYHVERGVKVGHWAVLNMDGTLFRYTSNEDFLRTFVPDKNDGAAQAMYIDAAFEKCLPGG